MISFFDINYKSNRAGAIATVFVCSLLYPGTVVGPHPGILLLLFTVFTTGVIVFKKAKRSWGKDTMRMDISEVVVDMTISVFFLPINFITYKRSLSGLSYPTQNPPLP